MSDSHKMIEKEFSWDEFVQMVLDSDLTGISYALFNRSAIKFRNNDCLDFLNGSYIFAKFHREDNERVKYGFGVFYPIEKEFEQIEVGQDDDGYAIYENGEKLELVEREVRLYKLQTF